MVLLCTKRAEKCTCVLFVYSVFSHFPKKMTKFAGENSYGMNMPTELSDMKRLLSATIALSLCACGGQQMHYYQLAQESLERQDAPQALHYLLQAAEAGNDADSLTAQVYSDIGSLYFDQGLTDKALQAYRRAYHADSLRNDSTGMAFDLRDIGNVYRSLENDDSSLVYFEHALLMTCDPMLRHDIESQMAGYHLWHGNYAEARRLLLPALADADEETQSGLYFMAAELYSHTGQTDSAEYYYRQLVDVGTIDTRQAAHRALADIAIGRGDFGAAAHHLERYETYTDSVMTANDAEGVRRVAALYDYSRHQQENARLRTRLLMAAVIIVMLLGVIISGALYYSRKRIRFRLKLKELEQLLDAQQRQPEGEVTSRNEQLSATAIAQEIQLRLSDPDAKPLTESQWDELAEAINTVYPNFTSRLFEFTNMSAQDYHVCLLLKLDIPPVGIATLTAHTKQAVSNTRSRLYGKAFGRKGSPAEWDQLIHSL